LILGGGVVELALAVVFGALEAHAADHEEALVQQAHVAAHVGGGDRLGEFARVGGEVLEVGRFVAHEPVRVRLEELVVLREADPSDRVAEDRRSGGVEVGVEDVEI